MLHYILVQRGKKDVIVQIQNLQALIKLQLRSDLPQRKHNATFRLTSCKLRIPFMCQVCCFLQETQPLFVIDDIFHMQLHGLYSEL